MFCLRKRIFLLFLYILTVLVFLEESTFASIKNVKIGVDQSHFHYTTSKDGSPYGYSYEYLEQLEEFSELDFDYIYGRSSELFKMLREGEIQLLDNVLKTKQLEEEFLFSALPTGFTNLSLVALADNQEFNFENYTLFNGIKIGFLESSNYSSRLQEIAKANHISFFNYTYPTQEFLDEALAAGRIDLAVKDNLSINKNEKIIQNLETRDLFFITTENNPGLIGLINLTQKKLYAEQPDFNSELYNKYFLSNQPVFEISESELDFLETLPPLRVLYLENYEPFSFYNPNTERVEGLNIQIWDDIAKQTNLKYLLIPIKNLNEGLALLDKNEADILLSIDSNYVFEENIKIKISDSFLSIPLSIVGNREVINEEDVFVFSKYSETALKYFKTHFPLNKHIIVNTHDEVYEKLISYEADFTIDNLFSTSYILQQPAYFDLKFVSATYTNDYQAFAIQEKIETELFSAINKAVHQFVEEENDSIFLTQTLSVNRADDQLAYFLKRYKSELYTISGVMIFIGFLVLIFIIFMQNRNRQRVWNLAYLDQLTGLSNFTKFKADIQEILDNNNDTKYAIIKIDINKFSLINEAKGQEEGDKILITMANALKCFLKDKKDYICRINADNFAIFYEITQDSEKTSILKTLYFPFRSKMVKEIGLKMNFSIGRYTLLADDKNINEIYEKVNSAHSLAKINSAISPLYDYDEDLKKLAIRQREIENVMEQALENNEFKLFLQAKYALKDETVVGAEALVRWSEPHNPNVVYPSEFIPIFEKNGFITKLDFYMFNKACEVIDRWIKEEKQPVTISVNFSRLHLNNQNFVKDITAIADSYNIPKKFLEIELTESTMIDNEEALENLVHQLHNAGFKLSMDDFGTGYSSLGLLKNLPVDVIKIDRSFFTNNRYKTRARTVLESIISMAKALNIHTVAEGVEELEHIDFLREIGCEQVQGYFYAKPIPSQEFITEHKFEREEKVVVDDIFSKRIGNILLGREELGLEMPIALYRLFEFGVRESLIKSYGEGEMENILIQAGKIAGNNFTEKYLDLSLPFESFIKSLEDILLDFKIGFFAIESYDEKSGKIVLTVKEDLECSGKENIGKRLCFYDSGFFAAILSNYTQTNYEAHEIDCWSSGAELCRFVAKPIQ